MNSHLSEKTKILFGLTLWGFIAITPNKLPVETGKEVIADQGQVLGEGASYFESLVSESEDLGSNIRHTITAKKTENSPVNIPKRIIINKISLNVPIEVVGYTPKRKWIVPDFIPATAKKELNVGGGTNVSIWGHREEIFARLGELEIGDEVIVFDEKGKHIYKISDRFIVKPEDVWVMNSTPEYSLTFITCDPPGTQDNRLILRATLL